MNTNFQTIHQMGTAVSEMVRQATGRNPVQSMDMDWVTVEQTKKWIYGEGSGDIVSFVTNMRNGITQLIATIMPVQDLHGYDNPWPAGGGKNLLPCTGTTTTESGVTFTVDSDGQVKITGENSTASSVWLSYLASASSPAYATGTYLLNGIPSGASASTYRLRYRLISDGVPGDWVYVSSNEDTSVSITAGQLLEVMIGVGPNYELSTPIIFSPMLRLDSVTDDSFVPYTNICPITGWNMCNVFVTGKNLLNPDEFTEGYYINDSGVMTESQYGTVSGFIPAKVGKIYALSGKATENSAGYRSITGYDSEGNFIQQWKLTGMAPAGAGYGMVINNTNPLIKMFRITFFKDVDINVQFEITTSMETAYEEFTGNTYTVIWSDEDPGVVYSGTLDVITGVLTIDRKKVLVSDLTWSYDSTKKYFYVTLSDAKKSTSGSAITPNLISSNYSVTTPSSIANGSASNGTMAIDVSNPLLMIKDLTYNDATNFANQQNVVVIYELATPITYQLDPITVESIVGTNYVMADTGNVSVEYRHEEEMP